MAQTGYTWSDLMNAVAEDQRWAYEADPSTPTTWDAKTERQLTKAVNHGYDKYKYPRGYAWSWMRKSAVLQTSSGIDSIVMPEDFGELYGQIHYGPSTGWMPIRDVLLDEIHRLRSAGSNTGYPALVAFSVQQLEGQAQQRKVAEFWPTPSGSYALPYQYDVWAPPLDADHPYPLGGSDCAAALLTLCLAAGEQLIEKVKNGPHAVEAADCLASAIEKDKKKGPKHFGRLSTGRFRSEAGLVDHFSRVTDSAATVELT